METQVTQMMPAAIVIANGNAYAIANQSGHTPVDCLIGWSAFQTTFGSGGIIVYLATYQGDPTFIIRNLSSESSFIFTGSNSLVPLSGVPTNKYAYGSVVDSITQTITFASWAQFELLASQNPTGNNIRLSNGYCFETSKGRNCNIVMFNMCNGSTNILVANNPYTNYMENGLDLGELAP
jgi:hypothetical protein